jgi:hypothetical protein
MTAATTIPVGHPNRLRTTGARAAFALAGAAVGSLLTFVATDDDATSASSRDEPAAVEAVTSGSAGPVSADAAERRAQAVVGAWERTCADSTASADAIERCISSR